MAKARIGKSGLTVKVSLSFREAAALHALLQRVGDLTNPAINDATMELYGALDEVRDEVVSENASLWGTEFHAFARRTPSLRDPDSEED